MATYIILLGPPGSGKGTQARLLAGEFGIAHVSTGDMFRALKTQDTPLARKVREIMDQGRLVPDDVTVEMVRERLAQPDCRKGVILDGFPRTVAQADALEKLLSEELGSRVSLVLLVDASQEEIVRRIVGRAAKEGRTDDTPEVAQQRYRVYMDETSPLIDTYQRKGVLVKIDGEQTIEAVRADLVAAIKKRI